MACGRIEIASQGARRPHNHGYRRYRDGVMLVSDGVPSAAGQRVFNEMPTRRGMFSPSRGGHDSRDGSSAAARSQIYKNESLGRGLV